MADYPSKQKADCGMVSSQDHEIDYLVKQLTPECPRLSSATIQQAMLDSKRTIQLSEARDGVLPRRVGCSMRRGDRIRQVTT